MDAGEPARIEAGRGRDPRPVFWGAVLLAACALFLGCDTGLHPIVLWDESRVVVNALEMSRTGFGLVTTYDFKPDLWNTKPPLLVWLIAGCIRLFGPSEWAVRTPSFLASLATVALVMRFSWRLARSPFVAASASVLLALSPGFFGVHAGQSADYEMLLCLFTTAYLLLLFELVHTARPKPWRVMACALLVAGACLTKGVAGLIPGVGVALYLVARGRWPRLFKTPWYALGGLTALGLVGGYYLLRERATPGYLAAVERWELGGRYLHGLKSHVQSPVYYLVEICLFFAFGAALPALCLAPALSWPRAKSTAFLVFGGYVSVAMLLVLSLSQTKIFWYVVPLYPVLSIMLAIVLERLLRLLPQYPRRPIQTAHVLIAIGTVYLLVNAAMNKAVYLPRVENTPQGRYGLVFAQLDKAGLRRVRTLDGGVYNDDDLVAYAPQLRFYTLAWRGRGMDIAPGDPSRLETIGRGEVVVTCDARYLSAVRALGAPLTTVPDCAAARSTATTG